MIHSALKTRSFRACAFALLCAGTALTVSAYNAPALARSADAPPPALTISNEPLPMSVQSRIYNSPSRAPTTTPQQVLGPDYYSINSETVVGRKIGELRAELFTLQGTVAELSENLAALEINGQRQAAEYYASVATISTQLQSGTTPGNPRLVGKLSIARENLEQLSSNINALNDMAVRISGAASMGSFLLESSRATYSLSGAIEEDHVRLAQLEDGINNTMVLIDRLLNNVNDDINRTSAYLGTERDNLRTLALAINTGDLFGKSLSNRPFSHVHQASFTPAAASAYVAPVAPPVPTRPDTIALPPPSAMPPVPDTMPPADVMPNMPPPAVAAPATPRPLVKIRFDRPDVAYEQPVYLAVNEALNRFPNARFELVAVHPDAGNAAAVAIESTRARRNAERVLRSLTEMGLDTNRVDLSHTPSPEAMSNEVHLYVK